MEKDRFAQIAKLFGFNINSDSIEVLQNEYDMAFPDNWDEMSKDEQEAWKKEHEKAKMNVQAPAPITPKPPAQPKPQPVKLPENVIQLNQLITDIGGMEVFKGLLLNATEAIEQYQNAAEQERAILVSTITANSGAFKAEDLEGMDNTVLRKLAEGLVETNMRTNVDFRMMGTRTLNHNREEDIAAPPSFLLAQNQEDK